MLYQDYLAARGREVRACAGYGEIGFPELAAGVREIVRGWNLMGT